MIKTVADLHTHTLASTHAYSTILENADYAASQRLMAIAVTDHGPGLIDSPHRWHFSNLKTLPPVLKGVRVLRGIEVNIMSEDGKLDLEDQYLEKMEWVIASMHYPSFPPKDPDTHTKAWIKVLQNPLVDCFGHMGNEAFRFDYESVISQVNRYGKIVEINNHSFEAREGSKENCREIARLCKKYQVPVMVNSDAHFAYEIGQVEMALEMLESIDFPQELILNSSIQRFQQFLKDRNLQ